MTSNNRARDLTWLVALAAALWGTDALLRLPLALQVAAPTIVFGDGSNLIDVGDITFANAQVNEAIEKQGTGDLTKLLYSGMTWEVGADGTHH